MKLASRILGGLTLAMLVIAIILTFVAADGIQRTVAQSDGGADLYSAVENGFSVFASLLGFVGYILMNVLGCIMIIYLICFCVSYGKLFKAKSNPQFIKYSAYIAGMILFFITILFAVRPAAGWKTFTVVLLSAIFMIAYAIVAIKYLKDYTEYNLGNTRYDEPPKITFDDDDIEYISVDDTDYKEAL